MHSELEDIDLCKLLAESRPERASAVARLLLDAKMEISDLRRRVEVLETLLEEQAERRLREV